MSTFIVGHLGYVCIFSIMCYNSVDIFGCSEEKLPGVELLLLLV